MSIPLLVTAKNIKEHFNLDKEPVLIFTNVQEGLNYLKAKFKGIADIYGFISLISKNIYIGSTLDLSIRPKKHLNIKSATNKHLTHAINLYGLNNFTFIVIDILG
jgi:hypothetical protein